MDPKQRKEFTKSFNRLKSEFGKHAGKPAELMNQARQIINQMPDTPEGRAGKALANKTFMDIDKAVNVEDKRGAVNSILDRLNKVQVNESKKAAKGKTKKS